MEKAQRRIYMKALVPIEGRLGKNPETRELPRGRKVTSFSVAVNKKIRKGDETTIITDWYNVEAWGYNAPLPADSRREMQSSLKASSGPEAIPGARSPSRRPLSQLRKSVNSTTPFSITTM
jgi:Single-strand binding protein family